MLTPYKHVGTDSSIGYTKIGIIPGFSEQSRTLYKSIAPPMNNGVIILILEVFV